MSAFKVIVENWQMLSVLLIGTGGSGWLGWLAGAKSRRFDFHQKVFQINSEMVDGVRQDFEDRIKNLKDFISNLTEVNQQLNSIITQQNQIITQQNKKLRSYRKKIGIDESKIISTDT